MSIKKVPLSFISILVLGGVFLILPVTGCSSPVTGGNITSSTSLTLPSLDKEEYSSLETAYFALG